MKFKTKERIIFSGSILGLILGVVIGHLSWMAEPVNMAQPVHSIVPLSVSLIIILFVLWLLLTKKRVIKNNQSP